MNNNLVIYRLRKYLRKLYEGYPTHSFYGFEIKEGLERGLLTLEEDGIIKEGDDKYSWRLTAEGLRLVESWDIEKLTYLIALLTLINILVVANQVIFSFMG
ncbi:MAG: hypothetical protein AABW89_05705 [Nanoarchaeota archaeon]